FCRDIFDASSRRARVSIAPVRPRGAWHGDGFGRRGPAARMHVRRSATHVEILTPAKINLFLAVLAKRPDGYHEIETVLVAVTAFDRLIFVPDRQAEIKLEVRWGTGLAAQKVRRDNRGQAARELLYGEIPLGPQNLV